MTRQKALDLVRKLLRTATANSGASDNERKTAAKHAVELITEHDLAGELAAPEPENPRRRRPRPPGAPTWNPPPPPPRAYSFSRANWTEVRITEDCFCEQCGSIIAALSLAWFDPVEGYIHHDIACAQERTS